eukprot:6465966-Prymnesium_polylepis.1
MVEIEHTVEALRNSPRTEGNVITTPNNARRDQTLLDWVGMDVIVSSPYNIGQAAIAIGEATRRE